MPQYAYARKIKNKNHSTVMWKTNHGKFSQHLLTNVAAAYSNQTERKKGQQKLYGENIDRGRHYCQRTESNDLPFVLRELIQDAKVYFNSGQTWGNAELESRLRIK
jgi:hypothetical protein